MSPDATALATLPPTVDVSAFRIVQEALTNAARHATGDRAQLALTVRADALDIEVTNDWEPAADRARRRPAGPLGSGLGVTGIAERAALVGGRVDRRVDEGDTCWPCTCHWATSVRPLWWPPRGRRR